MEFSRFKLGDLIDFNPTRIIKKGAIAPFVEMAAIPEGSREIEYSFDKEFKGSGSRFRNGDTLFARITPCLQNGKTAKVSDLGINENGHGSTEFIVMAAKDQSYDEDLVYYICRHPAFRDYAISRMEGTSGRQRVDWKALAQYEMDLPSKDVDRKEIADHIKILDDKIKVNLAINSVLEQISQTLFKSWFVDFEPVRAKLEAMASGENPQLAAMQAISGKSANEIQKLSPESHQKLANTAELFPDELVETEHGDIPKGWQWIPLYDTAEYVNGGAFKSNDFNADRNGLPIIKIAELKSGISPNTKFTTKEIHAKYAMDSGDLLYSWSGSPETSLEAFKWFGGKGWLNQHIFLINTESKAQKVFVYNLLQHMRPVLVDIAKNKQTTGLGHVTVADMKRLHVAFPNESGFKAILEYLVPLYELDSNNTMLNENLKHQRDALIPKLLSGELEIN
jgi:type I restriction enzyme S subunit